MFAVRCQGTATVSFCNKLVHQQMALQPNRSFAMFTARTRRHVLHTGLLCSTGQLAKYSYSIYRHFQTLWLDEFPTKSCLLASAVRCLFQKEIPDTLLFSSFNLSSGDFCCIVTMCAWRELSLHLVPGYH